MMNRDASLLLGAGALGIALFAASRRKKDVTADRAHASRTVTIRADAGRLHELWTQPERLATLFAGVAMEIVADEPGKRYEWRTRSHARYRGGGSLTFTAAPAERGTQARLALFLEGGGAPAARAALRLFGASLEQRAMETVRQFKALAEAGEVPHAVSAT
jgi:uncharacterized membrane protein